LTIRYGFAAARLFQIEALWEFNDTMERTNAAKQADAEAQ
jgi:hypothetical protein